MTSTENEHDYSLVWCFQCGNEYDADVEECVECGVPTTMTPPLVADDVGEEDDDQLAYELHEWSGQGRSTLDGMLTRSSVEHAWQGATLIVREADEEAVDDAIAQTEVVAMPTLDLTQPTVVYELAELDDVQHGRLLRRLGDAGMSHAFDRNGDLFVYERDEEAVDAIFEELDEADISEREFGPGVEGVDPAAVMSDLFVAVGRLKKRPNDPKGVVAVVETTRIVEAMTLPYGLGADVWGGVVDQASDLSDMLSNDTDADDIDVQELVEELYATLRPMV